MQRLRIRIVKKRTNPDQLITDNPYQKLSRYFGKSIYSILGSDVLPLIIAPAIFIIFAGLGWWLWYIEPPMLSAILPAITILGLTVYCFYKLGHKKYENKQNAIKPNTDQRPELR